MYTYNAYAYNIAWFGIACWCLTSDDTCDSESWKNDVLQYYKRQSRPILSVETHTEF